MTDMMDTELVKVIVFQLGDKEYALPVSQVQGIEKTVHITRVPRTESYVKGVINLRGVVTPIIDLRERFAISSDVSESDTRIIIISQGEMEVGLIVDAANDVMDLEKNSIEPQPEVVGSLEEEFIAGVAKVDNRLLILLNIEKVLSTLK